MKLDILKAYQPALFVALKDYNREKFTADLLAGVIVGIVALPLAIAFGIASGVSPEKGIYTAVIAGFIVSFLGGSNVQIGGPTGAFIVIVYGIVENYGAEGLAIATVLAGIMLLLMGFLKLGSVIQYIPYPIVVGFTSGIALTIFSTQINDLFGLEIEKIPSDFFQKWTSYFQHFNQINLWAALIGIVSIVIIVGTAKVSNKIPGSLVALVVMTVGAFLLKKYFGIQGIETIGDRFTIDSRLPEFKPIGLDLTSVRTLFPSAFTIAMLGAIESLLSATVADGATGQKHNSNMELVAQGAANIVTPFFGGIPATGAIARTMTNINNGGKTPVAGIIHAIVLLFVVLFLGDLTKHIPMACLAGILVIVSYNMSEWRIFVAQAKQSKSNLAVLITTFTLTVVFDLTIAIEIGLLLAVFLFLKRVSESTRISVISDKLDLSKETESKIIHSEKDILYLPKNVDIYEIEGPFFFGVANRFDELMRELGERPQIRIIRMRKVPFIDSTGLKNLEDLCKNSRKEKIQVILSGVNDQVRSSLYKSNIPSIIGDGNICSDIHLALERARLLSARKNNSHSTEN